MNKAVIKGTNKYGKSFSFESNMTDEQLQRHIHRTEVEKAKRYNSTIDLIAQTINLHNLTEADLENALVRAMQLKLGV